MPLSPLELLSHLQSIYSLFYIHTKMNWNRYFLYFTSQDTKCFQVLIPVMVFLKLFSGTTYISRLSLAEGRDEIYVQSTERGKHYGKYLREQSLTKSRGTKMSSTFNPLVVFVSQVSFLSIAAMGRLRVSDDNLLYQSWMRGHIRTLDLLHGPNVSGMGLAVYPEWYDIGCLVCRRHILDYIGEDIQDTVSQLEKWTRGH